MWKRAKRIALLLLITVLVVGGSALIFVQTSIFQQWLLRRVERMAGAAGYSFTAERLNLNLWRLNASLTGLVYDDGKTARVTVARLFVDLPWNAFRGNVVRITDLEVDGISADVRSGEPSASEPSGRRSGTPRFILDRLTIRNGSLTYSDQSTTVRIPSFDVEARNGRGTLRVGSPITISPDVRFAIAEFALQISDHSLDFGPAEWRLEYPGVTVTGSSQGQLQWSPSFALNFDYSTNPFSYMNWRDLESSATIDYRSGVLKVTNFQARSRTGSAAGAAEIRGQSKSVNVLWGAVNLAPAGLPAVTDGNLRLQWQASDFSDLSGKGSILINSRQFGRAQSEVTIRNARANLDIRANALDARVRAKITTGLDQRLSGTFEATHIRYGIVQLQGSLGGTFKDPRVDARLTANGITYKGVGPLHASAAASLRSQIVSIDDIQLQLKNSSVPRGSLRITLDSERLTGELPEIRIQVADFAPGAAGVATLSANIDGTIRRPAAQITGSSEGLGIHGTHLDSVRLRGGLTTDEFHLTEFRARQGEGVLNASGGYNYHTEAISGNVDIFNLEIAQIPDLSTTASLTASIGGTISTPAANFNGRFRNVIYRGQEHGTVDLEGAIQNNAASVELQSDKYSAVGTVEVSLKEPYKYTGSVTANRSRIQYRQYDVRANGTVHAAGQAKPFKAEQVSFEDFTLRGEGVDLEVSGSIPDGARVTATADLAQLPVESMQFSGNARAQAVVSGTIEDPRVEGAVSTSNATVRTSGMAEPADVQASIDFTRDEFTIRRLRALFAGATADITGRGNLKGAGHFQFRAEGIKPERMFKDRPVAGLVGVEGEVDLSRPSLDGISCSAKVTQLELMVRDIAIHQAQPIEITLENQIAEIRNFEIEGLDTRATITGNANLRTRALNFKIDGNTDLKLLDAFLPGSRAEGQIRTSVTLRGSPEMPSLGGSLNTTHMQLQISEPPIFVTDTDVEIQLRGDRIQIASATGNVNGGKFTASGGAGISSAGLGNVAIQLNLMGAQTEYPEGFQSEISSRLSLSGSGTNLELSGNVDVLNGVYQRDIDLSQQVLSRIAAQSAQPGIGKPSGQSMIDQIRLNITINTPGVVSVTNNLANFDMEGFFRLRGTIANPLITGRAMAAAGGEIYFGPQIGTASTASVERRDKYVISEGSIDFNNPIRTEATLNFVATRELQVKDERYIITLRASGTLDNPKTELTSDPYLAEPDIVAMLLTGRTFTEVQSSGLSVAREQAANYLSGRFGSVFQTAGSALGLNTVRLDPVLLAGDEDLSARLTIGKNITDDFSLVYSQVLSGPRAQTWIANYEPIKDVLIRGINQSDENTLTVELRHDLKWGGGPALPKRVQPGNENILGKVSFEGTGISTKDLLGQVTKPGKPFNAYRMNRDVRKLEQYFAGRDFLDVKIRAERNPRDGTVDVRFIVNEGPKITFAFEGAKVTKTVQEEIKQIWIRGFALTASLRQSQARLHRYLRDEGYLQATVSTHDESTGDANRRFVFDIAQGPRFEDPAWTFKGIEPIDLGVTAGTVLENPKAIQDRIQNDLWSKGYLNASCTEPELMIDGSKARFEISVERGPRYSIGKMRANDSQVLSQLPPGEGGDKSGEGIFTSAWLDGARQTIISKYWENGFNDVQVAAETHVPKTGTVVDIDFKIDAGEQQIFHKIQVEGNKTTHLDYILRQFRFKEGDPVDYSRVNLTRKNLYDTRLFKRVDLNVAKGANGYIAGTTLNESPPWNFRYGFAVTDQLQTSDRNLGGTADFSYANLLGKGITAGSSLKYAADLREGRIFGSLPVFLGKNATTSAALFRTRDLTIPESTSDLWGFTVQQQWRLRNFYLLSYDYSYKRNHTFDKNFDPNDPFAFNITIPIARFNGTLSRDTRDDILNASRGAFLSNSFEIAPPGVGSSIQFLRNYAQYFRFQPLKPRLVWANGIRVGVANGFHGQDLIPTERFHAGGGTTLRAFQQDRLAIPGDALFIVNQELRFPLFWRFSGVSFLDAGNVYSSIRDFNPVRLRYSPGIGIRVQTPFVLVRFDMGFNLFPRPGEPRQRFAFGVGQAF